MAPNRPSTPDEYDRQPTVEVKQVPVAAKVQVVAKRPTAAPGKDDIII